MNQNGFELSQYTRGVTGYMNYKQRKYIAQKLGNKAILHKKTNALLKEPTLSSENQSMPSLMNIDPHLRANAPAYVLNKIKKLPGTGANNQFL